MAKKLNKKGKIIITISSIVGGLTLTYFLTIIIAAEIMFSNLFQWSRPNYDTTPGLISFSRVDQSVYSREEFKINNLNTYLYNQNDSDNLIVFATGVHTGADEYLGIICKFVDDGFDVLAYDYTGCYESKGICYGFPQAIKDLDNVLKYVENNQDLKDKNIYLFGYSMGGYAVSSVLTYTHNVNAVASLAGINQAEETTIALASSYVPKFFVDTTSWYVKSYQRNKFGSLSYLKASDVISNSNIPTLIIQGEKDNLVKPDTLAIYKHKDEIKNSKADYLYLEGEHTGHLKILYSEAALTYRTQVKEDTKNIKDKAELKTYISGVNHLLYSEPNPLVFDAVVSFFNSN